MLMTTNKTLSKLEMRGMVAEAVEATLGSARRGLDLPETGPKRQLSTLCYGLWANAQMVFRKVIL